MTPCIDLAAAGKGTFRRGRSTFVFALWFIVETLFVNNRLVASSRLRVALLRLFGARIGRHCRCPHALRVKFPWKFEAGDNVWLGEGVWFSNQAMVTLGSNVCISQDTFVTSGSHDLAGTMDLRCAPIVIEDGAWVTARCVVQMGVTIGRAAVVTPNSVVHRSLEAGFVYGGNPCRPIRPRFEPQAETSRPAQGGERTA
jgi:putative colanic acid biosynthesis acetyltransferase WcaF